MQLRAVEVRAKIGAVGGYAPARSQTTGDNAPTFNLHIVFGDRTETITATAYERDYPHPTHAAIESDLNQEDE